MDFHDNLTKEQWLLDFFGYVGGRELASKGINTPFNRHFTNNAFDLIKFIEDMKALNAPAWLSIQPFREYGKPLGIEKTFLDMDDPQVICKNCGKLYPNRKKMVKGRCPKCGGEVESKPRPDVVKREAKLLVNTLASFGIKHPLITKTFKGYHIYSYLDNILEFPPNKLGLMKLTYENIVKTITQGKWFTLDKSSVKDIMRVGRVPMSWHERGVEVIIVDEDLESTKVREIGFNKSYPIEPSIVREAFKLAQKQQDEEEAKEILRTKYQNKPLTNGKFSIRPCFQERLNLGYLEHQMRLALLPELFYSGKKTEEELIDSFRCLSDFNENVTKTQVEWYLKNINGKYPPYTCNSLMKYGFCLKDVNKCPIYAKRNV